MSELLFVNACVRGERSRTLALARHFLAAYEKSHPEVRVTERNLMEERLEPQYPWAHRSRNAGMPYMAHRAWRCRAPDSIQAVSGREKSPPRVVMKRSFSARHRPTIRPWSS